jgi:uncharacterized protein (TIGR02996 family)
MARPARPEVLAFLADVKDNPDDLTPWLILTDWLEENGDDADRARAEYCRLCFDKLGQQTYASDWERGEHRRALFRRWKGDWFGPLRYLPAIAGSPHRLVVKRGLLHVGIDLSDLFGVLDQIPVETWAWVEHLHILAHWHTQLEQFAGCPFLAQQRHLHVQYRDTNQAALARGIEALAASPYLDSLRSLHLYLFDVYGRKYETLCAPLRARFGKVFC